MGRGKARAGVDPQGSAPDLARDLGAWFDGAARDLPWRRTRDPWAILLSEVMLQQTRVDTVQPYYRRMLERFPTPSAMAEAKVDDVLELWSGLGYYRRARSLWLCAREIAARGGAMPEDVAALRELPGIGPYTAGAIASIAFDAPVPLVDGNVARVLARSFGVELDVKSRAGQVALWEIAARIVPAERPGRFNQALMELGATICTPKSPSCAVCPLERVCVARRDGKTEALPVVAKARPTTKKQLVAAVLHADGGVVLGKRPFGSLFGGLWEPPMIEAELPAATTVFRGAGLVAKGARLAQRGELTHVLTHRELHVDVVAGRAADPLPAGATLEPYEELSIVRPDSRGISTLARRVLALASGAALAAAVLAPTPARAEPTSPLRDATAPTAQAAGVEAWPDPPAPASADDTALLARLRRLREPPGLSGRFMGSMAFGKGIRFNNPYRLATQLGDDAASLSATATYFDVGLGGAFGDPEGLQHGAAIHLGGAIEGVSQAYVSTTYLAVMRPHPRWLALGRAGPTFLLTPDPNAGGEIALGGAWFATAGFGVGGEAMFDLFYGAATPDGGASAIPIVSLQLGLYVDLEALP
jgi:A/G-specific adenine glycosylase